MVLKEHLFIYTSRRHNYIENAEWLRFLSSLIMNPKLDLRVRISTKYEVRSQIFTPFEVLSGEKVLYRMSPNKLHFIDSERRYLVVVFLFNVFVF